AFPQAWAWQPLRYNELLLGFDRPVSRRTLLERAGGVPALAGALVPLFRREVAPVARGGLGMTDDRAPVEGLTDRMIVQYAAAGRVAWRVRAETIGSSAIREATRRVRRVDSGLATGLAYPRDRYGVSRRVPAPVVALALAVLRRTLPLRLARMLSRAGADVAV